MGRTRRKRKNRKQQNVSLENISEIITLKKWMSQLGWQNHTKLILKDFHKTGRGVSSLLNLRANQKIIEIPFELLITIATVLESEIMHILKNGEKFKAQDILAMFLALEKHKKEKSKWKHYLGTLPEQLPSLPWLSKDSFDMLPSEFFKEVMKKKWDFQSSKNLVEKSIDTKWSCLCCKEPLYRVITSNAFTWGYVMVNTRAVYVQPDIITRLSNADLSTFLSDEPCLALCPFLDMFNHSSDANTQADLVFAHDSSYYTLTTRTSYNKHEQIFISYGEHDNNKLLCEYGFFIPYNFLDRVQFDLKEILESVEGSGLDDRRFKFVKSRCLDDELYVSFQGLSFNLKAVIYLIIKHEEMNWCRVIYSEGYRKSDYEFMYELVKKLLKRKLCNKIDVDKINVLLVYKNLANLIDYCKYRQIYVEKLLCFVEKCIDEIDEVVQDK